MKTKEFREYLKKQGLVFTETEEYFEVNGLIVVYKKYKVIDSIWKLINTPRIIDIYKKAIDYTETPLEEREEEKRYLLTTPFAKKSRKLYLYFNDIEKRYYLNDLEEYNQNQFTQKEIDAMPFDTNFFIKEEVK